MARNFIINNDVIKKDLYKTYSPTVTSVDTYAVAQTVFMPILESNEYIGTVYNPINKQIKGPISLRETSEPYILLIG